MFKTKLLLTTLALGSLAFSAAAFANGTTDIKGSGDRDDVRFECRFRCEEGQVKGDDGECKAEGQLDADKLHDNDWVCGDHDDFLQVRCDCCDQHGSDADPHKIIYGRHFDDLFITGGKTTSPLIIVEDVRKIEGEHHAKILIQRRGQDMKLDGECRFERHQHGTVDPFSATTILY